MIPSPGVRFAAIDSTNLVETGDELSVWLEMSDGTLVGCYLPIGELIGRGHTIEEPQHLPTCAVLQ